MSLWWIRTPCDYIRCRSPQETAGHYKILQQDSDGLTTGPRFVEHNLVKSEIAERVILSRNIFWIPHTSLMISVTMAIVGFHGNWENMWHKLQKLQIYRTVFVISFCPTPKQGTRGLEEKQSSLRFTLVEHTMKMKWYKVVNLHFFFIWWEKINTENSLQNLFLHSSELQTSQIKSLKK